MKSAGSSETLVPTYETMMYQNSKDRWQNTKHERAVGHNKTSGLDQGNVFKEPIK
jgi:hypothetical protein